MLISMLFHPSYGELKGRGGIPIRCERVLPAANADCKRPSEIQWAPCSTIVLGLFK